jgi:2-methylisocitrate lyase-like PEP mutase family enzyme
MGSIEGTTDTTSVAIPAASKLRDFLENSADILLCPGVYDGFSARIALSIGFNALYMVCP